MDIDKIEAGRELDALVAEKVMGLVVVPDPVNYRGLAVGQAGPHGSDLSHYSTDIAAAWQVVEKIQEIGILEHLEERNDDDGKYVVQFCAKPNEPWWHKHAFGESVPLAICRAALKAVQA